MYEIVYFAASLLTIWAFINLLYLTRREWFNAKGFNLYYGFILIYRRGGSVKGSKLYSRISYVNIGLFALALATFYLAMISSLMSKLGFIGGGARVQLLIPGINITGEQLIYFGASVAIAAAVHEYLHAYTASSHGLKVKSFGVIIAVVLPLAFTEVDEEEFSHTSLKAKITTLAAGPASNYLLALLAMFLATLIISPYGIVVVDVQHNSLAEKYGIKPGDILIGINDKPLTRELLAKYLSKDKETNFTLEIISGNTVRNITIYKPRNVSRLGIAFSNKPRDELVNALGLRPALIISYITIWMYIVNLGLAIINAAPIFISDGGRIFYEVLKNKNIGHIINTASLAILVLAVTL